MVARQPLVAGVTGYDLPEREVTTMAARRKRQTSRKVIDVEPRVGDRWAVQTRGTSRASRIFDSKADAVNDAARRAKRARPSQVIIKN
jgi:hypothetical protein